MVTKTSLKKVNLHSFNLYRDNSNSLTLSNSSELFLSRIAKKHIQIKEEKEKIYLSLIYVLHKTWK